MLYLHPNTLRYRLDRIAGLTGLDLRRFGHTLELLCTLSVLEAERAVTDG